MYTSAKSMKTEFGDEIVKEKKKFSVINDEDLLCKCSIL